MSATCPSSWHQSSRLLCSLWQLVMPVYAPVLRGSFQMCSSGMRLWDEPQAQTVIQPGGPQQARAQTPGTRADLPLLCAHCKHSRGAEGGSSPWTRRRTQTLLRKASGRSPSCVHKPLSKWAEILFHFFFKTKMSGLSCHIKRKLFILMRHFKETVRHFVKCLSL